MRILFWTLHQRSLDYKRLSGLFSADINTVFSKQIQMFIKIYSIVKLNFQCDLYEKYTKPGKTFIVRTIEVKSLKKKLYG